MPNNSAIWRAIVARELQHQNEQTMPTGDPLPNDARRGGSRRRTPIRITAQPVRPANPEPELRIHNITGHGAYYRYNINNTDDRSINTWIELAGGWLTANGFYYVPNSNYFFNNKCGIYIFGEYQILLVSDISGYTFKYNTNTPAAYHLIGYLVFMGLLTQPVNDTNGGAQQTTHEDKYEF